MQNACINNKCNLLIVLFKNVRNWMKRMLTFDDYANIDECFNKKKEKALSEHNSPKSNNLIFSVSLNRVMP